MAKQPPPPAVMVNLITGYWVSRLVYIAAKLKLADLLKGGPRTVDDLATATGVQASALYRVLRALSSVGVFAETKDRWFKLTPLAATLQTGVPASMNAFAQFIVENYWFDAWSQLLYGVKTGELPFLKAHRVPLFEYLEQHPDDLQVFGEAMTSLSATENPAVAAAYKFSGFRKLVDVAGGHGSLLATILKGNPKLKGVLFDLPSVIARAGKDRHVTAKGIAERLHARNGRFLRVAAEGRRCLHHEVHSSRLG